MKEEGRDGVGSPDQRQYTFLPQRSTNTHIIQVEVNTAVMSKYKIADGIGSLDGVFVAVKGV